MSVKSYKIKILKPVNTDWKMLGSLLRDMDYVTYKAKNKAMTMLYDFNNKSYLHKEETGKALNAKELYGMSINNHIKNVIKKQFEDYGLTDDFYGMSVREANSFFSRSIKEVLSGSATLPTFKRGNPIPIRATQLKLIDNKTVRMTVMNKEKKEHLKLKKQSVDVQLVNKGQSKVILNRLESGEYKLSDSHIQNKGKDWFLILSYKAESVKQSAVDKNDVLGVDLGIAKAAVMTASNSLKIESINGGEINHFRRRVEARRNSMRNQLKVASENRKGHGSKTLLKPLEKLESKVSDFRKLTNHRYSKKIVDTAVNNGCGVIQMEDLSGIKNASSFLANWSYFDLQQKTKYKAEELGIEFKLINPKYTSQRCNKCGVIDSESRKSQEFFNCTTCGHKMNADANAARNIAMKDIEKIIMEQCEIQNLSY